LEAPLGHPSHADATAASGAPGATAPFAVETVRLRMLAVLWLIVALVMAPSAIGAAVINARMATDLHMEKALLGSGFGLFITCMGLSAPLAAVCFRFFGIRNVALGGTFLAATGSLLMGTVVSSGPSFAVAYGLMMGVGVGIAGILPVQTVIAAWFVHRRALAVSVILSAVPLSGMVLSPTINWLMEANGTWRAGWWLAVACFGMAALLVWWAIPGKLALDPRSVGLGPEAHALQSTRSRVYKTSKSWEVGAAVKTRQFALLLLFNASIAVVWTFFLAYGVLHVQDLGHSATTAATVVSIVVASSLVGVGTAGILGDRIPPHWLAAFAMLLCSLGLLLGRAPTGFIGLIAFAVVLGFGHGVSEVCLTTTLTNYFGAKAFPALFGIAFASGTVVALSCTVGTGWLYDQIHSYRPAMLFGAGLTAVIALLQLCNSPRVWLQSPAGDGT
jgi:MFS family permease